jgi:hypothetical protein
MSDSEPIFAGSGPPATVPARMSLAPDQAAAPPTIPGVISRPPTSREPSWPMVVGVVAIVFGALGMLAGGYGLFAPLLISRMSGFAANAPVDVFGPMERWKWFLAAINAVGLLLAIALLTGGIGLASKRPWSRALLLLWAVLKVPYALAMVSVTISMQRDQFAAMQTAGAPAAIGSAVGSVMVTIVSVVTLTWYLALPTFVLIWLSRRSARELVLRWRLFDVELPVHA